MKKISKLFFLTFIITSLLIPMNAYAEENAQSDMASRLNVFTGLDTAVNAFVGAPVNEVDFFGVVVHLDGKRVPGITTYPDYDSSRPGLYELHWLFTPNDTSIEPITGTVKVNFIMPPSETVEAPTTPSLTASTVQLNTMTTYDINLDNKISGSTYNWTSSDASVVEVNAKSGLLKAKKEGKATVTCVITLPDKTTKQLTSEVFVGYDDNAPVLTETELDLEPGDVFDINLENKVAKAKYRWASSDRSIAKVNSANGKVTAVAPGTAFVTCTITTLENQVIVLRADISVTAPTIITE